MKRYERPSGPLINGSNASALMELPWINRSGVRDPLETRTATRPALVFTCVMPVIIAPRTAFVGRKPLGSKLPASKVYVRVLTKACLFGRRRPSAGPGSI